MEKIIIDFFEEKIEIEQPKDIGSLRNIISKEYYLSQADLKEIIIYYLKDNQKVYIKTNLDYENFIIEKILKIYIDISQSSQIYLNNLSKLKNEGNEDKNKLKELIVKKNKLSKFKEKIIFSYFKEIDEITYQIRILNRKKYLLMKKSKDEINKIENIIQDNDKKIQEIKQRLGIFKEAKSTRNFSYSLLFKKFVVNQPKEQIININNSNDENNKKNTISVFTKVDEILSKSIGEIKEIIEKPKENRKEEIDEKVKKIEKITEEATYEINNLIKLITLQSKELISKIYKQ